MSYWWLLPAYGYGLMTSLVLLAPHRKRDIVLTILLGWILFPIALVLLIKNWNKKRYPPSEAWVSGEYYFKDLRGRDRIHSEADNDFVIGDWLPKDVRKQIR